MTCTLKKVKLLIGKKFRTQLPQAVGAAYSLKMDGKSACAVTYCGDGSTSEVSDDELNHLS